MLKLLLLMNRFKTITSEYIFHVAIQVMDHIKI